MTETGVLKTMKWVSYQRYSMSLITLFSQASRPRPKETTQPHTLERVQDGENHIQVGGWEGEY